MEFRIGINLGDVVEEAERIYGDGVNIAARIEGLAEGGGICISGTAFDQIGKRLPLGYEFMGEQAVKNIEKPVRVYRVLMEPESAGKVIGEKALKRTQWRWAAAAAVVLVAGALALWNFYFRAPKIELASKEKMAFALPDEPSIAVLPFVNMSEDPKQEFLSDGITEEITTALSKIPRLFVISRQSTFSYKGKPVKVKQVAEELGVQYVLEGSVQRSGDRIRINAQLIDALIGRHMWAERYDRKIEDIFALQDDITMKILTATQVKLMGMDQAIMPAYAKYFKGKQGLDCYLKFLEATAYKGRVSIEANNVVRGIAEDVMAMCPDNPMPYALMANVHNNDYWFGTSKSPRESLDKAVELLQKSLSMDDSNGRIHGLLGQLYTMRREYDKGIAEGERAVALDPGGGDVLYYYAWILNFAGRYEEAISLLQRAIRLNPLGATFYHHQLGNALQWTGRFGEAVSEFKKVIQRAPDDIYAHAQLAATYSMMGREEEARSEVAEVVRINPKYTLDFFVKTSILKDRSKIDDIVGALRKAGLK